MSARGESRQEEPMTSRGRLTVFSLVVTLLTLSAQAPRTLRAPFSKEIIVSISPGRPGSLGPTRRWWA
jgi:hypothetical protein